MSEYTEVIPAKEQQNESQIIKDEEVEGIIQNKEKERTEKSSEKPNISDEGAQQITLDL